MRKFLFFLLLLVTAGLLPAEIDYAHYDVPLYDQIVMRIQGKIAARLGDKPNLKDRYFIIPFAYQNRLNTPDYSHSFLSVIRVFADNRQPKFTRGLRTGKHKNREFEAFTISWLPSDFFD